MYPLEPIMLAALVAVAIPIIIHLLNRQKATLVDWGAMRFLLESLTSRSRRILIEEIILMALRCLALALLALAMARLFIPSRSAIPWALVLPAILAAAMCAGIAAAVWSSRMARWILLAVSAVLVLASVAATGVEYYLQGQQWSLSGGERDVAIVIDASTSMSIPIDGQTNFQRAIEEAREVVEACRPADAMSIILAGPVPRPVIANPVAERKDLDAAFRSLSPTGGSMRAVDAMMAAGASLAQGHNPAKKIVLITDGQNVGWDVRNEARWEFLATSLKDVAAPPETTQVICRTLSLPRALRNAAVADIRFSRKVVGTDRPVRIDVTLLNTGTTVIEPQSVELSIDGASVARQEAGEILPGAAETVRFDSLFEKPGLHVVSAKVLSEDEMPSDNTAVRVVDVVDRLPVLVVEGDPSLRPLDGAAAFIEIALTPTDEAADSKRPPFDHAQGGVNMAEPPPPKSEQKGKEGAPPEDKLGRLVALTTVAAPEIQSVADFRKYRLVILANVPRLPHAVAENLRKFVQDGGGLLIVTGDNVVPAFYNGWLSDGGQPFVPAVLARRKTVGDTPAHLGLKTFSHPALTLLADATQSDAERAIVTAYWGLDVDQKDPTIRIGALLDTGDPLVVERRVGNGYVLMTAVSLDRRESNLPSLKCYVPLVHELAYYLASPALVQPNVRPGSEFVVEFPFKSPEAAKAEAGGKQPPQSLEVVTPSDQHVLATGTRTANGLRVAFSGTYEPGLYHLVVTPKITDQYAVPPGTKRGLPFVVLNDPEEGRMVALTDAEIETAGKHVNLFRAQTTGELALAVSGQVPGEEMWKYLAIALLVALLAEVGLTRWIALQRRMHIVETVSFGPTTVDVKTFRERARSLLAIPKEEPQGTSKA